MLNHHHGFLADYSRQDSPIHRLPAAVKLLAALALVIATLAVPVGSVLFYIALGLGIILVAVLSRVPPFFLIKRVSMLEPVVLGVAVLVLFQPNGGRIFAGIAVRSTLCLSTMVLLSNTTPFADLLDVLRRFHTPALLVTTLALMYRYLFVLGEETSRMRRARASRTFSRNRGLAWRNLASIVGHLFVRTHARGERVYAAMCSRGWK